MISRYVDFAIALMDLKSVLLLPDHYDIGKDMLESMDKICRDLFASDFE